MLLLIEKGEVYAPEPRGRQSILLAGSVIARIGESTRAVPRLVGVLGVDATTWTLPDLLARVQGLEEEGITACERAVQPIFGG